MKKNIFDTLLDIVRDIVHDTDTNDEKLLAIAYLDEGYIDSFQLIEMIATVEKQFGMKFSAADLTSNDFRTFSGVARIIAANVTESSV